MERDRLSSRDYHARVDASVVADAFTGRGAGVISTGGLRAVVHWVVTRTTGVLHFAPVADVHGLVDHAA